MSLHVKYTDLPEGTVIEVTGLDESKERYERSSLGWVALGNGPALTLVDVETLASHLQNVKVVSVPYAVTLKLAEWLDNVYTKRGTFESLIVEAGVDAKKTKHDAHISAYPTTKG